jgi:hypothetical protein
MAALRGAYQAVLHHTRHGHGPAAPAEVGLHRGLAVQFCFP